VIRSTASERIRIKEAVNGVIEDLADHDDAPPVSVTEVHGRLTPALAADELRAVWREGDAPVLCVAGRGSLDEAAAMLAHLIQKHGIGARVVPSHAVLSANVFRLDSAGVTMICLSYLEPSNFANARYLVRRLRHKFPQVKILLGLWSQTQAEIERLNVPREIEVDFVVTTLADAVDRVLGEARESADISCKTPKATVDRHST
jgi:hypothetical protein